MEIILQKIRKVLNRGDKRTTLAKKNIAGSLGLKGLDILIDFLLVPISLAYLTKTDYGIWLTINSMVVWLNFFDVGISHGYRNMLAEALSVNDFELARKYTSTTYIIIGLVSFSICALSIVLIPLINWQFILNVENSSEELLKSVVFIVIICFAIRLSSKIITSTFQAKQMPFWKDLSNTSTKIVTVLGISGLLLLADKSLFYYASIYSIVPLLILAIMTLIFYRGKYKKIRPSFGYFDCNLVNPLMGVGVKFFVIQVGATMLFMTDNIIISHLFDPSYVTPYQIAHKYFGIVIIFFSIIIAPFWSAITEAYTLNEYDWIRKTINKLNKLWLLSVGAALLLLILFYPVLEIWVGNDINVSLLLAIQWTIFVILQSLNMIYTYFLNGTGKIHLQMIINIFTLLLNIPLSIFFAKNLDLGTAGVLLATNVTIIIYVITKFTQYKKIINKTAYGIWNR